MQKQPSGFDGLLEDPALWKEWEGSLQTQPLGYGNPAFLFGVATSTYQDSGHEHCPNSQWSQWEKETLPDEKRSMQSANLFQLYKTSPLEVIQRLQQLSVNMYRFSIEWSQIQPKEGVWDQECLATYVEFCKLLREYSIQPMITLHHFSEPMWFHNKGSFEKEENIGFFVEFCKRACEELMQTYQGKPLVEYFCTINEPAIEAYSRYLSGYFPPNLAFRFVRGAKFLYHMLKAHSEVYEVCKAMASARHCSIQVGMTHQYLCFYAHSLIMVPLAKVLNKYQETVLHYFKTGVYDCRIPFFSFHRETLKPKTDFVGVQFYARVYLGLKGVFSKGKPMTTMWGIYEDPEGLYEAIVNVYEAFKVPVIVTESGISTQSDAQRARFISRALASAAHAADKIGRKNFLGYILWSFTDNYEWFLGWKPRFGTYSFCLETGLSPHYKKGTQPFVDAVKLWKRSLL